MNDLKRRAALLSMLLASFPETAGDSEAKGRAYLLATDDIPLDYLTTAAKRFMKAEVEGRNPAFCPSTAELCAEARRLVAYDRYVAHKADADKLAKPKEEPLQITDEARKATIARMREKFPTMFRQIEG
jgi:hypothetical protein